jgi:hypothetical protein
MVEENWDKVSAVAEALLRLETLQREDVDRLMRGELVDKPTVAQVLAAKPAATGPAAARPSQPPPELDGGVVPSPA